MTERQRRVIVCGSADCCTEVEAVCTLVAKNSILDARFQVVDAEISDNVDALINAGFRSDDILVLLLGDQYGGTACEGKSLTEILFDEAGEAHLKRLVFVKTTDAASDRQKTFARKIDCLLVRKRYATTDDAVKSVFSSLGGIMLEQDQQTMCCVLANEQRFVMPLPAPDELARFGKEYAQKMLDAVRVAQDKLHERIDPLGCGNTFHFKTTLDDLDMQRLEYFIAPEVKYLEKCGAGKLSVMDFLKIHNYADSDGRIYDVTLLMFGKTAFQSALNIREKPKRENQKLGFEAIRFAAELWVDHQYDTDAISVAKGRRICKKDVFCHFQKQLERRGIKTEKAFRLAINDAQHQEQFRDIFARKPRKALPLKK